MTLPAFGVSTQFSLRNCNKYLTGVYSSLTLVHIVSAIPYRRDNLRNLEGGLKNA